MKPYEAHQDSRLWHALASAMQELEANGEVRIGTAPEYVVGFLCQELSARGLATAEALAPRAGRRVAEEEEGRTPRRDLDVAAPAEERAEGTT